ncbi:MAG: hypothetical protein KME47_19965 [Nodosilinea sp. WJT8-NPBG4]|jgi:hypothetical protein|nr:hypothetical protein [Nodosilinea sp. WJT8-NPBG4]
MALSALRVVVFGENNRLVYASVSDRLHANRIVRLTLALAAEGKSVRVLRHGRLESEFWSWGDDPILLGENGQLTDEMPAMGSFYLQLAQRQTTTSILFNPAQPILIDA